MSSELVQTGFFDLESVASDPDEVIISTDWMTLPDEDFEQLVEERHRELDQQEAAIDALVKVFKSRIIRERGDLYMMSKAKLEHGRYLKLLEKMGVSPDTAQGYTKLVRDHGKELSNAERVRHLSLRQWIRINRSPESHQIIAKLETGEIEATSAAINDEIEAVKRRAKEAEDKYEAKQKELDLFKEHSKFRERNREQIHVSQILAFKESEDKLKLERDQIDQQLKALREQTANGAMSPETKKRIEDLQVEIDERTKQRDNLAQLREKLSKELDEQRDANKARHEQEMYEHRINDRVKKITEEWGKCSVTLLGQLPSPIESQVVTGNNWALLDHAADMAQKIIDAVKQAKISKDVAFLNSEVPDAN